MTSPQNLTTIKTTPAPLISLPIYDLPSGHVYALVEGVIVLQNILQR